MGIYELAAIHLRQNPTNLAEAALAIDALTAVLDKLAGRLGENEQTLIEAQLQLQQAFVAVSSSSTRARRTQANRARWATFA